MGKDDQQGPKAITNMLSNVSTRLNKTSHSPTLSLKDNDQIIRDCCIDGQLKVHETMKLFKHHQNWPGVILMHNKEFTGMISRTHCYELLGRPFGNDVFSNKPILEFHNTYRFPILIIDADTSVQEAAKKALDRDKTLIYEPIIIVGDDQCFGLLSMHDLLHAQSSLLENLYSEVHHLSIKDSLTSLNNRRGFFDLAQLKFCEYYSNHKELSALMIDIDNFKIVNDTYGHFIGDQIIRAVAEEFRKALRQEDLLGRFGGEEFIALLPNTSVEMTMAIAEQFRKNIESRVLEIDDQKISVTVSVGISQVNDAEGSLDVLLSLADQAMYWAKTAGRNRVMIWDSHLAFCMHKSIVRNPPLENIIGNRTTRFYANKARIYDETIVGWVKALEMRDIDMEGHAQRVINMTIALAKRIQIDDEKLADIQRGAVLHDIGKIALPDRILFKTGPLTAEEWVLMKKHPVYAQELLSQIQFLKNSIEIPYCHHEHWDGNGYPRGLKGEEIPLAARLFTIIDVWDALSTNRCYRPAWQPQEVMKYLVEQSGKLFDPNIIIEFIGLLKELTPPDQLKPIFPHY